METNEELIDKLEWNNNIKNREEKEVLARKIASKVKDGDVISFGSGTTSFLTVKEIAKKCQTDGLTITAIPTSNQIELLCKYLNINTAKLEERKIDWGFDGADEVNAEGWLIKGLGGALYREKRNLLKTPKVYILVDKSKIVKNLGEKCPVPVECDIEKEHEVREQLIKMGATSCNTRLKNNSEEFFVSDNGRHIIDAKFSKITSDLERKINEIDGVLDNGLFINYKNTEIITI